MQNIVYKVGSNLPETIFDKEFSDGYGTLSFDIPNIEEKKNEPLLFHIYIDVSGSMSEIIDFKSHCSKIQLLKHILINVLHHITEKCNNIYIQVKGFDDNIHDYIDTIKVTKDNIQELLLKIEHIRPLNSTNIGLALQSLNIDIDTEYFDIPIENRVAIMLTDGEPTTGICTIHELVEIISKKCSHHFIALGNRHNGKLMQQLGHKNVYTTNWFVGEVEHTGNVYGEILFNETHRVLSDVTIKVLGGKIYDFNQGIFVDKLELGTLYEETTKNYHISIEDETEFNIILSGKNIIDQQEICLSANKQFTKENDLEIIKQYLRLYAQKLMFSVRQDAIQSSDTVFGKIHRFPRNIDPMKTDDPNNIITNINKFYDFITKYMKDNGLEIDDFMVELVKDVNVMKNSFRTRDGYMYVSAREDSQGRQTAFNTASRFEYDLSDIVPPKLERSTTSAYTTPLRCELMRNISENCSSQLPHAIPLNLNGDYNSPIPLSLSRRVGLFAPPKLVRQTTLSEVDRGELESDLNLE